MFKHFQNIYFYVTPLDNYYCIYKKFSWFVAPTTLLAYGNMGEVDGEIDRAEIYFLL